MTMRGTLAVTEPHPATRSAVSWLKKKSVVELMRYQEVFSSCAISNNRLAEVCGETLQRWMTGQPVSDRYLLGLVWTIRDMEL